MWEVNTERFVLAGVHIVMPMNLNRSTIEEE